MQASLSGTLASMGCAVPYAIAAKFAHPERAVVALLGDGAFQMNGMNELITVSRYWRHWVDPRFVVCVFNNRDLNQVTWEQRVLGGDRKFEESQSLPDFPVAQFAELAGLEGICVDRPDQVGAAWERALAAERPVVIEAIVDAEIAPLPPHVTFEQAGNLAQALLAGDAEASGVARKALRDKLREFLPGR